MHLHRRSESILDRVRGYFCEQISLFASHLCEGSLVFHPRVADLSVHNIALLAEMHALNPYVVSWSNVSDYMYPADFHSMARRISGPDTVHYLHSCNWTTCVYGVDVYDINEHARGFFFNAGMEICSQSQKSLVFAAVPVSHYRNFCQVPLTRKFIKHYLRYFFKGQEDVHVATCNGLTPISMPNPCLRSNEAAHLIMCYGSAVNFGANSYDYMNDDD